ncbi:MAG: glycosyl hydrolase family 8, partial [Myxococcales bacterium]
ESAGTGGSSSDSSPIGGAPTTTTTVLNGGTNSTGGGASASATFAVGATTAITQLESKGGAISSNITGDAGASTGLGIPTQPCLGGNNLFSSLMGKSSSEVETKLRTAVNRFFGIDTGEPSTPVVDAGYRVYYELPQNPNRAFIWAADSNDIRSEGMSYGMTIAVQADLQIQFNRLWNFAKTYMQIQGSPETWRNYFRWQGTVVTTDPASWTVAFKSPTGPAPDGEEYFAAALYMAHNRWGSAGNINYKQEADNIVTAMLHNVAVGSLYYPVIHTLQKMVVFYPAGSGYEYTDPSYHVPAFYELFSKYGPLSDAGQWKDIAATSRNYLRISAHATTGLHPDYATFAGSPTGASNGHDRFAYDAWRVVMNMAVDYVHSADFALSPNVSMRAQVEKYHAFFRPYLGLNNVTQSLFSVDGTNASGGGSTALTGTLAVGSLASTDVDRAKFVSNLWNVYQQTGKYRYYQECLYLMSLLHVAGNFHLCW